MLKHGENIIDTLGAEVDRLEKELKVSQYYFQPYAFYDEDFCIEWLPNLRVKLFWPPYLSIYSHHASISHFNQYNWMAKCKSNSVFAPCFWLPCLLICKITHSVILLFLNSVIFLF